MSRGMAIYELKTPNGFETIRLFMNPNGGDNLTRLERDAFGAVSEAFLTPEYYSAGDTSDPYLAAEQILRERYGYARMVKADYRWVPGVRY